MTEPNIKNAIDAAQTFLMDERQRMEYINREMAIMDYESDKASYLEEGMIEGMDRGRNEERIALTPKFQPHRWIFFLYILPSRMHVYYFGIKATLLEFMYSRLWKFECPCIIISLF
mgnify:CR=1 FL=1